jgi:hypothetical protein
LGGAVIPSCGEKSSSQKFRVWGCTVNRLGHFSLSLCLFFSFSIEKAKEEKHLFHGFRASFGISVSLIAVAFHALILLAICGYIFPFFSFSS